MKRRILCLLCAILCLSCARAEEAPELLEPVGVQLATARAEIGDMYKIHVYDGAVAPYVEGLAFEIDGALDQVNVYAGQMVKQGDVLLTLDQESEKRQCESLQKQLDALRTEDQYARQLHGIDRSILEIELDGLRMAGDEKAVALKKLDIEAFELNFSQEAELRRLRIQTLESEYAEIQQSSRDAVLTAPFDGRIMFSLQLNEGDRVSAYAPVLYMADDSRLHIQCEYVPESNLAFARELYVLIGEDRHAIRHIPMDTDEFLNRVLSGEDLTSDFELVEPVGLTVGEYAAVCLTTGYREGALIIPRNALYSDTTGKYVYIVEDGARTRREVETGIVNEWQAQITSGLEEGEIVYVQD